jgi:hypothetical protein
MAHAVFQEQERFHFQIMYERGQGFARRAEIISAFLLEIPFFAASAFSLNRLSGSMTPGAA